MFSFLKIAEDLELAGLIWRPEIGDEVSERQNLGRISVLVDPEGMAPAELRSTYLWLPTLEQMLTQLEARQVILFHAGLELSSHTIVYKAVLQSPVGPIESHAETLRGAMGLALRSLLLSEGGPVN